MELKERDMRNRINYLVIAFAVMLAVALTDRPGRAAGETIRIGMIPDAGATQVSVDQKKPLRDYLAAALGQSVDLIIPTNYNATVEALGNGSLDFAYLGGPRDLKVHALDGGGPAGRRDG